MAILQRLVTPDQTHQIFQLQPALTSLCIEFITYQVQLKVMSF